VPSSSTALRPAVVGLRGAALTFALFMVVELAIYGKGIGRAVWVSAVAALVIFGVVFAYLHFAARGQEDATG
jgi:hypothetical protein